MFLPAKNGHPPGKWFNRNFAFVTVLTFVFYAVLSVRSTAQIPKSASPKAELASPVDPLRRDTPRSAVEGLLRCDEREDAACAARYLQPPPDQQVDMLETAREFRALHARYKGNVATLSDDPNGKVEEGLPPGQERAGVIKVGGTTTEVILPRVDDPNYGKIWLVSGTTVAQIPQLYAGLQKEKPTLVERMTPAALAKRHSPGDVTGPFCGVLFMEAIQGRGLRN